MHPPVVRLLALCALLAVSALAAPSRWWHRVRTLGHPAEAAYPDWASDAWIRRWIDNEVASQRAAAPFVIRGIPGDDPSVLHVHDSVMAVLRVVRLVTLRPQFSSSAMSRVSDKPAASCQSPPIGSMVASFLLAGLLPEKGLARALHTVLSGDVTL